MTYTTATYNGQVEWKVARSTDTPTYFEVDTFARSEGLSPEGTEQWAGGAGMDRWFVVHELRER